MAKSIIAGEYILQIADNGHVDVVRVFRNAYQTMKNIAAENNFEVEEKWNTQTLGSKLVKQFGDGKTAKVKDIIINKMDSGKIEIYQECKNTIEALRTIAKQMNFEYDENWNTQTFGAKMAAFLEEHKPEADKVLQTPNAKPAAKEEVKEEPKEEAKASTIKLMDLLKNDFIIEDDDEVYYFAERESEDEIDTFFNYLEEIYSYDDGKDWEKIKALEFGNFDELTEYLDEDPHDLSLAYYLVVAAYMKWSGYQPGDEFYVDEKLYYFNCGDEDFHYEFETEIDED